MVPHFKRLCSMAATVVAGLTINYLYGLWGEQSVPSLQRLSRFLWGSWSWTGGALTLFAIVSVFAARAHRRQATPHFIGGAPGLARVLNVPREFVYTPAGELGAICLRLQDDNGKYSSNFERGGPLCFPRSARFALQ